MHCWPGLCDDNLTIADCMNNEIIFIAGVSGSGKTTIGRLLANRLGVPFFDGDDYHSAGNVEKMRSGVALEDDDRWPWLQRLNELAVAQLAEGAVIACSALKPVYRQVLEKNLGGHVQCIWLQAHPAVLAQRISARADHFMPPALLSSQLAIATPPAAAFCPDITMPPESVVAEICKYLGGCVNL